MRLAKPIEFILGMAASGSMVLVLSGSAFAADAGTGTTSQTVVKTETEQTTGTTKPAEASPTPKVEVVKSQTGKTVETAPVGAVTTTSSTNPTRTNAVQAGPDAAAAVPIKLRTEAAPAAGQASVPATIGADKKPLNPVAATTSEASPVVPAATDAAKLSSAAVPEVQKSVAVQAPKPQTVVYRSEVLPIQPRITNTHPAAVADLAAMVPTAPEQRENPKDSTPTPSQPSGAFGQLTAVLAGSIVPTVFLTPSLDFDGLTAAVTILIILCTLLLVRTVHAFVSWTRRGGFAHAPRSDVAATQAFSSFFATPLDLSYASAFPPMRNSFSMVSKIKTVSLNSVPNAIRKEDML